LPPSEKNYETSHYNLDSMKKPIQYTIIAALAMHSAVLAAEASTVQPSYDYQPVRNGIEIRDGNRRFNRPLYSSVDRPWRVIALAGDRPEFMLMRISATKSMTKLANVKLGLADGPWLDTVPPVLARHDHALQSYQVGGEDDGMEIAAVRARAFDALLLRVKNHRDDSAPLVLAIGGMGAKSNYDQFPDGAAFKPGECRWNQPTFAGNTLTLAGRAGILIATGSVPLRFMTADPNAVAKGPKALLEAPLEKDVVSALSAEWPASRELYFVLSPDAADSSGIAAFRADPAKVFAEAVEDNRKLASTIEIDTPDPYLNAALPSAVLGFDAAWNAPTFRHGAIAWHDSFAGWRSTYAATPCGWHDRVQSHMHEFYSRQTAEGRIPSKLENDSIYNMGEVLVDQALYDYEWTGNLDPLRKGGFDAIARHLAWGEKHLKTPDGLYENFLNAWNTDYKWCNGGGGTIASSYFWRANKTMAEIAKRLGKDASVFEQRASEISAAMKARLWSETVGVYGEYRDSTGLKLLHESPDLSSIYTPIDLGFTNPFESYRMLRFGLRRFERIKGLPRGGELIYASEWLPDHYSSRGIYTAEIINTLLTLYRTGQSEAAEPLRRAVDGSFYEGPGMGCTGYTIHPDGTYKPHTDFTDMTSMYVRNVVEGLFGIRMNAPDGRITLQPSFPADWDKASIRCPGVAYRYTWDGVTETMAIQTPQQLSATIRLRARRAEIDGISVNGKAAEYTIEPGVGCCWVIVSASPGVETQVQVNYGKEELPQATFDKTSTPGQPLTVRVDRGQITQVRQSREVMHQSSIAGDGKSCTIPLPAEAGVPTFFVLVTHGNTQTWMPVEVDVRPAESFAENESQVAELKLHAETVDLSKFRNQRLADLHNNEYGPRIKPFYWADKEGLRTVQPNGRSWWEKHSKHGVRTDTGALTAAAGRFVTDNGIPFDIPATGPDSVFTTRYENFPNRIEIPIGKRGRKVCVLVAASLTIAQSRMENARITVTLGDGKQRVLALRNPESIDDWLGSGKGTPYVLSGRPQALGTGTHVVLQEIDLGGEQSIESLTLETFTEETLVGLLGITVLQDGK
jgi:hypothetical protein